MKKVLRYLVIIILVSILYSCNSTKYKDIYGTWIFDYEIDIRNLNDTTAYYNKKSILFDFLKDSTVIIKNYQNKFDTIYKWKIKSDYLFVDTTKYKIQHLDKNKLVFREFHFADTSQISLKKVLKTNIKLHKKEIESILLSKIWSVKDTNSKELSWLTHFEFFDNNRVIYRYKFFDRIVDSLIDNLQFDNWKITKYKNNYFYYSDAIYRSNEGLNQILEIDSSSFIISNYFNKSGNLEFYSKQNVKFDTTAKKKIIGTWTSKNSLKKNYGRIPNGIKKNRKIRKFGKRLFDGNFKLIITENEIIYMLNDIEFEKYKWEISKDGKIIFSELPITGFGKGNGVTLKCMDILELTENTLKLRLFDNMEGAYYLNLIQDFKKETSTIH